MTKDRNAPGRTAPLTDAGRPPAAAGGLVVDVWGDVGCPFCYIGDALFSAALARFPHAGSVEVRQHSYELRPDLEPGAVLDAGDVARALGITAAQATAARAQMAAYCARLGLPYDIDAIKLTSTHAAHRVIQFAESRGRGRETAQRLARAHFGDGADIGDPVTLAALAAQCGLDRDAAETAARSGAFDAQIEADRQLARQIGVRGVPHFVFAGTRAVFGAQPQEAFLSALQAAWDGRRAAPGTFAAGKITRKESNT